MVRAAGPRTRLGAVVALAAALLAGLLLSGCETNPEDTLKVEEGEPMQLGDLVYNVHISPYSHATNVQTDPLRTRKLLLHEREIKKLTGKVKEKGFALIPTKIYFIPNGKVKIELALARGKKLYDKRAALKKKQSDREIEREYKKR